MSHLIDNQKKGFSFFFAGFIKKSSKKGFIFIMKILLLIKDIKIEKEAQCILQKDANLQSQKYVQANFICEVTLESNESTDLTLSDPYSVTISPANEIVSGCSELNKEESSPKATDIAIENPKMKIMSWLR